MLQNTKQNKSEMTDRFPPLYDTQELFRNKLNRFINLSLDELVVQVNEFIRETERSDFSLISSKRGVTMCPEETSAYFRSLERHQNNTFLLQYMLCFLSRLPRRSEIDGDLADPFKQFKGFIHYNLRQLTQPDVLESIFNHLRCEGYLKSESHVQCRLWIYKKYKEILGMVQQAYIPEGESWKKLFTALKLLSIFWFSINNYDMTHVRKVDVFIYLLSQYLIKKY